MSKRTIAALGDLRGKRVLVRVDFNVPLTEGTPPAVADDYRLEMSLPVIRELIGAGARVVLCSHLGRPKAKGDPALSLRPVAARLGELLGQPVAFHPEVTGDGAVAAAKALPEGGVLLLENLRYEKGEQKNDPEFGRALAAIGEVAVNDAFGVCHRPDASVDQLPRLLPAACGPLIAREIAELTPLRDGTADRPFVVVLGGAKLADKIPVLHALIGRVDSILIGGGMAYTFLKAMGKPIGNSRFDADTVPEAAQILEKARERSREKGQALVLPRDHVVARSPDDLGGYAVVEQIPNDLMGLDIGPATLAEYTKHLAGVKTVFWNGPLGVFEKRPFHLGTHYIASFLAGRRETTRTIVGGGDSAAAARSLELADRMHWVSTGGGASLEFVQGEALPGVEALPDA